MINQASQFHYSVMEIFIGSPRKLLEFQLEYAQKNATAWIPRTIT